MRTAPRTRESLFSGLAFSRDGSHVYASMASLTDPRGKRKGDAGSGIAVCSFAAGKIAPERLIHLPVEPQLLWNQHQLTVIYRSWAISPNKRKRQKTGGTQEKRSEPLAKTGPKLVTWIRTPFICDQSVKDTPSYNGF